jgi:alkylation response protein AidB-like acyl-CoA dehydrogenase
MRHSTTLAVLAAVFTCAVAQAGDVYKYVDERGMTMYTDKPIPGAVLVSTGSQRPADVAQRSYSSQQTAQGTQLSASNERIADQQNTQRLAADVARDLEATRLDRCKKARADYQQTIASRRLYRDGGDGKRTYLSEAELAAIRVEAKKAVETVCGPQG